jgi:hypothetical protein
MKVCATLLGALLARAGAQFLGAGMLDEAPVRGGRGGRSITAGQPQRSGGLRSDPPPPIAAAAGTASTAAPRGPAGRRLGSTRVADFDSKEGRASLQGSQGLSGGSGPPPPVDPADRAAQARARAMQMREEIRRKRSGGARHPPPPASAPPVPGGGGGGGGGGGAGAEAAALIGHGVPGILDPARPSLRHRHAPPPQPPAQAGAEAGKWFRVDQGGAVAFRSAPRMEARTAGKR